jgi:hypothetical protein
MERFSSSALKAALLLGLVALSSAGIIMQSDQSQVCATNLRNCQQSCSPPPNFVFSCSSGGVFSSPTQQCDCVVTAPGTSVDGGEGPMQGLAGAMDLKHGSYCYRQKDRAVHGTRIPQLAAQRTGQGKAPLRSCLL